ncbi:MAG: FAD-dependent oxidoreductase [Pseudomonadota bacterium]
MAEQFDVVVIGGGLAGFSVAYELAASRSVAVVEAESATGYHATGRSASVISENYGPPLWKALASASRAFLANPPKDLANAPLLRVRGALTLAQPHEEDALRQQAKDLAHRGIRASLLGIDDILKLCPVLRRPRFSLGLYEPDCQDIDTNELMRVYERGFKKRNGRIFTGEPLAALQKTGALWRADTQTRQFQAPLVVNAAGGWARNIAQLAGLPDRKVMPFLRTAITFDPPGEMTISNWPIVFDVTETFYFKPEAGQIIASPVDMTPCPPGDVQAEELEVAVTIDRIERHTTLDIVRPSHTWGGLRTFASDHEPVIGPDPEDPSFVWLAGQGGNGVMGAPAAARLAAALALNQAIPSDIKALGVTAENVSPGRPAMLEDVIGRVIDLEA